MKNGQNGKKWRKTTFFEIKIDLQLRFDIKKYSYYLKKWRLLHPQFYLKFFPSIKFIKIWCQMALIECTAEC
jgi:hypothetical protein